MKKNWILAAVLMLVTSLSVFNCEYNNLVAPSSNIVLHNKPLDVIRVNVQGKWRLLFVTGGISGGIFPTKYDPYMNITGDHIIAGNDLSGVILDTVIVWKREIYNPPSDYTYLMGTPGPPDYPGGLVYKIVDRIQNDTLILMDNASDAFYYYYSKSK